MLRIEKSFCINILGIHTFHFIKKKNRFFEKKEENLPLMTLATGGCHSGPSYQQIRYQLANLETIN